VLALVLLLVLHAPQADGYDYIAPARFECPYCLRDGLTRRDVQVFSDAAFEHVDLWPAILIDGAVHWHDKTYVQRNLQCECGHAWTDRDYTGGACFCGFDPSG
jgi:hypothetical protein